MKKAIGKAIKIMRVKEELRQQDLADHSGLSQVTIANMENGTGQRIDNLVAVCQVFEISLSDLIILAEEMI